MSDLRVGRSKTGAARVQATLDDIVRFTLGLPDVVESTSYGQPALKRGERLIFALRTDLETLALVCGLEERAALIKKHPGDFFITDHYLNYPSVVVQLATVNKPVLRAAVKAAWERLGSLPSKKRTPARTSNPQSPLNSPIRARPRLLRRGD